MCLPVGAVYTPCTVYTLSPPLLQYTVTLHRASRTYGTILTAFLLKKKKLSSSRISEIPENITHLSGSGTQKAPCRQAAAAINAQQHYLYFTCLVFPSAFLILPKPCLRFETNVAPATSINSNTQQRSQALLYAVHSATDNRISCDLGYRATTAPATHC